jgi:small nuclear ribonucleoprotein (snRNP)-like protein
MTIKKHLLVRNVVALLAAIPLLWIAPPVYPQSAPTQDNDITRQELAGFDQFLDSHREIAEQLRKNPSLVNDSTFAQQHQALQTYLQQHPAVREELKENPNAFMRQENRYDRREDARDSDVTRQELAQFERFLDGHRETADQLRKNPSLVNDRQYVDKHSELQTFLQQHPAFREELKENPNAFMRQENRFDERQDADRAGTQDRRDNDRNGDRDVAMNDNRDHSRDIDARSRDNDRADDRARDNDLRDHDTTRGELRSFDQFLDKHREIAEQLRKNPGLVNNQQFLDNHPALQTYLGTHKGVREEISENPQAFMRQENRFDNREDANRDESQERRDNDRNDNRNSDRDVARNDDRDNHRDIDARSRGNDLRDHDTTRGELRSFDQFLDKHREIAEQLRKNPALVNDQQFLANHPALQAYLGEHNGVREEIGENPQAFMQQEAGYDRHENGMSRDMDRERASFGAFLHSHSAISEQLSKNPSLLKNQEFMATHTELQDYLKAHPAAQAQLTQNPDSFIKSSQQFSTTTKTGTTSGVKTTPPDATKPPKQ